MSYNSKMWVPCRAELRFSLRNFSASKKQRKGRENAVKIEQDQNDVPFPPRYNDHEQARVQHQNAGTLMSVV